MTEQPRPLSERPPFLTEPVHYVAYGTPGGEYPSTCRAATVTAVGAWVDVQTRVVDAAEPNIQAHRQVWQAWYPDAVALCVMNPTGMFFNEKVRHDPGALVEQAGGIAPRHAHRGGTWHHQNECQWGNA